MEARRVNSPSGQQNAAYFWSVFQNHTEFVITRLDIACVFVFLLPVRTPWLRQMEPMHLCLHLRTSIARTVSFGKASCEALFTWMKMMWDFAFDFECWNRAQGERKSKCSLPIQRLVTHQQYFCGWKWNTLGEETKTIICSPAWNRKLLRFLKKTDCRKKTIGKCTCVWLCMCDDELMKIRLVYLLRQEDRYGSKEYK